MKRGNTKDKVITFRIDDEEWGLINSAATASGEKTNEWCRDLVLEIARGGRGMTRNERVIFEELSRVRYLVGNGFRLLTFGDEELAELWEEARENANVKAAEIADQLLSKSHSFKTAG